MRLSEGSGIECFEDRISLIWTGNMQVTIHDAYQDKQKIAEADEEADRREGFFLLSWSWEGNGHYREQPDARV